MNDGLTLPIELTPEMVQTVLQTAQYDLVGAKRALQSLRDTPANSRELSVAITNIETGMLWLQAAIVAYQVDQAF